MSQAAELKKNEYESANGSPEKKIGDTEVIKDEVEGEGEESDDYETDSEEEKHIAEDEEDEGEGEGEQQDKLTHLLIPNGATAENEAEYDDDDDDDEGDEDGDDDYVEEEEDNSLNKKRSIDEVADKEASQGSKKIKV